VTREKSPGKTAGFTLIELALTLAVAGALSAVALVNYLAYLEKARVASAVAEIEKISHVIDALLIDEGSQLPDSLADVGADHMRDPWGGPYQYLKIAGGLPPRLPAVSAAPTRGSGAAPAPTTAPAPPTAPAPTPPTAPGGGGVPVIAEARKDQFLVPINSDYDLYSMGADGQSNPSLNSRVSLDDVIRARDGAYVGLAEQF
jgi:general secretion pathway protein G